MKRQISFAALLWLIAISIAPPFGLAQDLPKEPSAAPALASADLEAEQRQIAEKFKHFEEVLLRMAELTAGEDPRRAALLRKAVAQSKDDLIGVQLSRVVDLLKNERLSTAATSQKEVHQSLTKLLELLLSENRGQRLASEQARLRDYLKL